MHALKDILYDSHLIEVRGNTDISINGIGFDSRAITKNMLFVAVKGTQSDGHDFIVQAIENGAIAVICEQLPTKPDEKITWVLVKNSTSTLGEVARIFYDDPSSNMQLVGVTGTNGKTTLATLLYDLFIALGYKTGLLSTVKNCIGDKEIEATHTTPDIISLNALLKQMLDEGCEFCFMEVSSHAIDQNRIAGIHFKGMVFTNLTHDHLDYHKTFDAYLKAKKKAFDNLDKSAFALVNIDDKHGAIMVQNTIAHRYDYSLQKQSDFKAKILETSISGLFLDLAGEEFHTRMIGKFNAYNLLAAYAVAYLLGENKLEILTELSKLEGADGRFNHFMSEKEGVVAIVDYAHTPDALKNVLETIKGLRKGIEKVYTVVGCGGDRDKAKRPMMADIACEFSDQVILTSDNPRDEDPEEIIADMKNGLKPNYVAKVLSITNRQEAIRTACTMAHAADIILVAGKGHEKYQEIKGEKFPFDDKVELVNNFKMLAK